MAYTNDAKVASSYTKDAKVASSYTNGEKVASSYTKDEKVTSSYDNDTKINSPYIVVGSEAKDRLAIITHNNTVFSKDTPSLRRGTIKNIEIWFRGLESDPDAAGVKVGTFYGSGTTYTCRDSVTLGAVTKGSKQTFTGLSLDVEEGDFIGYYCSAGRIEAGTTYTFYYIAGDKMSGTNEFTELGTGPTDCISLRGTD